MTNPSLIYNVYKKDTEERRAFARNSFDVLKTIGGASFVLGAGYLGFANDNPDMKNPIPGVKNLTNFMNSSGRKEDKPLPTRKIGKAIRDRSISDYQARTALAKEKAKEVTLNLFDEMSNVNAKDKLDEILAAKENQRITHLSVILDMINDPELNLDDETKGKLITKVRGAIEDSSRMSDADKADIAGFLDSIRSNKTLEEKYVSLHQKNSNVAHLITTSSKRANNGTNSPLTNPFETFSTQKNVNTIYHRQNLTASNLQDDAMWSIFKDKSDQVKNTVLNRYNVISEHLRLGNNNSNFNVSFDIIKEANEDAYGVYARISSTHNRASNQPLIIPLMAAEGQHGKYVRLSSDYGNAKVAHNHYFDAADFAEVSKGQNLAEKQKIARDIFNKKMPKSSFEDFAINLLKTYSRDDLHYMNQAERNSFMEVLSGLTQYYPTHGQMNFGYSGLQQKHGIQIMSNTAYFFNKGATGGKFPVDLNELVALNIGIFGPAQGQAGTIRKELKSTSFEQQAVILDPNVVLGKTGASPAIIPYNIARTHGIKDQSLLPGSARIAQLFAKPEAMLGYFPANTKFGTFEEMQQQIQSSSFGRTGAIKTSATKGKDLLVVGKEFQNLDLVGANTGIIIDFNSNAKKGQRLGLADAMQYRGGMHLISEPLQKSFQYTQGMTNLSIYESDVFQKILAGEEVNLFGDELETFFKNYGDKDGNLVLGFKDNMPTTIKKQRGMLGLKLKMNTNVNTQKSGMFSIAGEMYGSHEGKIFSEAVKGVFFGEEQILDEGGMKNVLAQALYKKDPATGKFINQAAAMSEASNFLTKTYMGTFGGKIESTMIAGMDVVTKGPQFLSSLLYGSLKMLGYEDDFIESSVFNMKGKIQAAEMDTKVKQHAPKYQKIVAENIIETFSELIANNVNLPTVAGGNTQQVTPEVLGNLLIPAYHNLKEPATEPGQKAVAFKDQLKGLLGKTRLTTEQQKVVFETAERGFFIGAMSTFAGTQSTINKDRMARVEPRFANFVMGNLMGMFQMSEDEAAEYMAELFSKQSGVAEKAQAMTPLLLMGQSLHPSMDQGALKHSIDDFVGQGYLFRADEEFTKKFLRANVDVDSATALSNFLKEQQELNPQAMGFVLDIQQMFARGVEGNENINTAAYQSFLKQIGESKTELVVPLSNVLDVVSGVEIKSNQKDLKIESELYRKVNDIFAFLRESAVSTEEVDQTNKVNQAMYHVKQLQHMLGGMQRQILSGRMSGSATLEGKGVRLGDIEKDQVTRFVSNDVENAKILQKMNAAFIQSNGYNMFLDTQAFMYAAKTFNEKEPGEKRELYKKFLFGMEEDVLEVSNGTMRIVNSLEAGTFKPESISGINFRNPQLGMSHIGLDVAMYRYAGENLPESHYSNVLEYNTRGQIFLSSLSEFMGNNQDFRNKLANSGGQNVIDYIDESKKAAADINDAFSFLNFKSLNILNQLNKTGIFKDMKFDFQQTTSEYLNNKRKRIQGNINTLYERIDRTRTGYRNATDSVDRLLNSSSIDAYENLLEKQAKNVFYMGRQTEKIQRLSGNIEQKNEYIEQLRQQKQKMLGGDFTYTRKNDAGVEESVDRLGKGFMNYYKTKSENIKKIKGGDRRRLSASRLLNRDLKYSNSNLNAAIPISHDSTYFNVDGSPRKISKEEAVIKYGRGYNAYDEAVLNNLSDIDIESHRLKLLLTQSKRSKTNFQKLNKQREFQSGIIQLFGGKTETVTTEEPILYTSGPKKGKQMHDLRGKHLFKTKTESYLNVSIFHPDFKISEELQKQLFGDEINKFKISEFNNVLNDPDNIMLMGSEEANNFFKHKKVNLNMFDLLVETTKTNLSYEEKKALRESGQGEARLAKAYMPFVDLLDVETQKLFYEHDGNDFVKDPSGSRIRKIIKFDSTTKTVKRDGKTKTYSGFNYIKYNIENFDENGKLIQHMDPNDPNKTFVKHISDNNVQLDVESKSLYKFMQGYVSYLDEQGFDRFDDLSASPLYKAFFKMFNHEKMNERLESLDKKINTLADVYTYFGKDPAVAEQQIQKGLDQFSEDAKVYRESLKQNLDLEAPQSILQKNQSSALKNAISNIFGLQDFGLQQNKTLGIDTENLDMSDLSKYLHEVKEDFASLVLERDEFQINSLEKSGAMAYDESFTKLDDEGNLVPFAKHHRQEKKRIINALFSFVKSIISVAKEPIKARELTKHDIDQVSKFYDILEKQSQNYEEELSNPRITDETERQKINLKNHLVKTMMEGEKTGSKNFVKSMLYYAQTYIPKVLTRNEQEILQARKEFLEGFFSDDYSYSVTGEDAKGKFTRPVTDSVEDQALLKAFKHNFALNPDQTTFGGISATRLMKDYDSLNEEQKEFYNRNILPSVEKELERKEKEALSKVKINKGYELLPDGTPDKTKPIYYDENKQYNTLDELDEDIKKYEQQQISEYKAERLKKTDDLILAEENKLKELGDKRIEAENTRASIHQNQDQLNSSHLMRRVGAGDTFTEHASDFDQYDEEGKLTAKGQLKELVLDNEGKAVLDSESKPTFKLALNEAGEEITQRESKTLLGKINLSLGLEDFTFEEEIDLTKYNQETGENDIVYKSVYDTDKGELVPTNEPERIKVKKVNKDLLKNFIRVHNYLREGNLVNYSDSESAYAAERNVLNKVINNEGNILQEVTAAEGDNPNRYLYKIFSPSLEQLIEQDEKVGILEGYIKTHQSEIDEINLKLSNPDLLNEEKQFHTLDDIINEAVDLYDQNYTRANGLGAGRAVYPEFETTFQFQNTKDGSNIFDIKVRTDLSRSAVGDFDGDIYQIILNNEKTSNAFKGQIQRNVREMQKTGAMMVVNMEIAKKAMSKVAERMDVANITYQDLLKSESSKERILKAGTGSVDVAVKKVAVGAAYNLAKGNLSLSEFRKTDLAAQLLISASQESVVIKSKSLDLATNIGELFTQTLNEAFKTGDTTKFETFMRDTVFKDTDFLNDLMVTKVSVENMPEPLASAYTEGLNKERITFNFDDIFEGLRNIIKTVNEQNLSPYASDNMLGALMSAGNNRRFTNEDYLKLVRNFDVLEAAVGSQGLSTPEQQALFENLLGVKKSSVLSMVGDNIANLSNMKMTAATAAIVGTSYLLSSSYDTEELRPEEIFTDTRVNEKIKNRELAQVQNYNSDVSVSPDSMQRPFYKDMVGRVQSPGSTMLARNQSYLIKGNVRNIEEANYMNKIALQNGGSSSIMINDNRKPLTGGYLDQLMGE